jgi:methyl-accepting chemotaxis protein
MIASVQRTVTSVEQTPASLPKITGSINKSLALVDGIGRDVKATTGKLSAVIDSAQSTVQSVKTLTESVKGVNDELVPFLEALGKPREYRGRSLEPFADRGEAGTQRSGAGLW